MVIFVLKGEKWYDKLFKVKYLPLFHHFKAIYQFPKHIFFFVKIVANASLSNQMHKWSDIFYHVFFNSYYVTIMIHAFIQYHNGLVIWEIYKRNINIRGVVLSIFHY